MRFRTFSTFKPSLRLTTTGTCIAFVELLFLIEHFVLDSALSFSLYSFLAATVAVEVLLIRDDDEGNGDYQLHYHEGKEEQ